MEQVKKNERNERIDKTIDDLRKKFGFNIIKRGTLIASDLEVAKKFKVKIEQ